VIILLNGAFGIGKTTVARLLSKRMPDTALFDPELAGIVLQRAGRIVGRPVGDFQDMALWRRLTVLGVCAAANVRENVIVPMAFSNLSYLDEIRTGLSRFEPVVFHFCLVAPIEVVRERLRLRGAEPADPKSVWQYRRADECCVVHQAETFAEHVSTIGLTAPQVADEILARVGREMRL
jgi:hypothetical protein